MCHVTIGSQNVTQAPYEKFEEETQDRTVESAGAHDLFQFLGNKNNPGNVKK